MTISVSITKITKSQWLSIGKVFLWIAVSFLCSEILTLITHNIAFLGTSAPIFNILGVIISKIVTQEENAAINDIPENIQPEAKMLAEIPQLPQNINQTVDRLKNP